MITASMRHLRRTASRALGMTLIEIMVSIAIFTSIGVGIYKFMDSMLFSIQGSRTMLNAVELLQEQLEIVRNLPYASVGVSGGIPSGTLQHVRSLQHAGQTFTITTTVRNVDDPTDGTLGGAPNDLSPADYKLVEIEVGCPTCRTGRLPVRYTTTAAPKSLETASTNGALFVQVIDSVGLPVVGANVSILNQAPNPDIVINDITGNDGWLRIVDAPPGAGVYEITVSKAGYSTERTYPAGGAGNPNPSKPHATVAVQTVTQITFAIDKTSSVNVTSTTESCGAVANIPFTLTGAKVIGPSVLKYSQNLTTNGSGALALTGMEWDTYTTTLGAGAYGLKGMIPLNPLSLTPDSTQNLQLIVGSMPADALLVTVKDAATGLPVPEANAVLTKSGYTGSQYTGRGFTGQTDWSGGAGQADMTDVTKFFDSDGNIDVASPTGVLKLRNVFGIYVTNGTLISSTIDTGSASNFHELLWQPTPQPAQTGTDSAKFQFASNNDGTTWNFLGPDGTSGSYYTVGNQAINAIHNGDQYFRYKVFLSTADTAYTPSVSDVNVTFTSSCVPPGQTSFTGLGAGTYNLDVSKAGYQTSSNPTVNVNTAWSEFVVTLTPS